MEPTAKQLKQFNEACREREIREAPTLLLVEDQRFFLQVFRTVLGLDYRIITATSGEEGWELYLNHAPDIAFLDIELGGMNGHALASGLRRLDAHAFLVMVTATSDRVDVALAMENKVRGFVTKPYSKKKIFDCIDLFMSERVPLETSAITG